jgi:pimeloyl-ACP methyl ester carboxylesterase
LSQLGLAYPDRVDKLVYLDAADLSERFLPDREEPPGPAFTDDDVSSLRAFQAAVARFQGHREPNAARCNALLFGPTGRILGSVTPEEIGERIIADMGKQRPTNWRRIRAPRLGIFATFSPELRQPWYWYLSADEQAAFDRAWLPIVEWHVDTIERFGSHHPDNPEPIVRELLGGYHYIYIYEEAFVVREMREFLLGDVRG